MLLTPDTPPIMPAENIPDDIQRAIRGETSAGDRKSLKRPRVVLSTSMRREDPNFHFVQEINGRRG